METITPKRGICRAPHKPRFLTIASIRIYWSALARAAQAPDFAIPIVRKEHLVALAMLERDWEAFDCIVGSMVPFRRRTVRRIILRDLGSHAARLFDVAVARSVGVASRGRGGSRATRGS